MDQRSFVLYCIKNTTEILKKQYQWLDCNIPSWVTWRKLNLSDGFDCFQFLEFLKLKRYIIEIKWIG